MMKLDRLADSGDELYNTAHNATHWQKHVAYVLFIVKIFYPFLVF
jgi:hypothetical protein